MDAQPPNDIDDSLYSRQRCVLGENGMRLLSKSKVFICGLSGVGVEIAKNIILAGMGEVIIQDGCVCEYADLGTQFYIREADIKLRKTRAEASLPRLAALNPYVKVTVDQNDLTTIRTPLSDSDNAELLGALLKRGPTEDKSPVDCLVLTGGSLHAATLLDIFCRMNGIRFIYTEVYGAMGHLFCDFGPNFIINDPDGEPPKEFFIGYIEKLSSTGLLVKVFADRRHHLETGDVIQFSELTGMNELNDRNFTVRVTSPSEFIIDNVETDGLSPYFSGGIGRQIIQPKRHSFKNLLDQLLNPSIVTTDLSRPDEGAVLHRVFLGLKKFQHEEQRLPNPWDGKDWTLFYKKFLSMCELLPEVSNMDLQLVRRLALSSKGQLAPLCAFFGGVVAQETMKAVTGCFTPFDQWLYVHCDSVIPRTLEDTKEMRWNNSRYATLEICIGPDCLQKLRQLSVFIVGCGAIGCELLKNLALLGIATCGKSEETSSHVFPSQSETCLASSSTGQVVSTDNPINTLYPTPSLSHPVDSPSVVEDPGGAGDVITEEFVPFTSTSSDIMDTLQPVHTLNSSCVGNELGDHHQPTGSEVPSYASNQSSLRSVDVVSGQVDTELTIDDSGGTLVFETSDTQPLDSIDHHVRSNLRTAGSEDASANSLIHSAASDTRQHSVTETELTKLTESPDSTTGQMSAALDQTPSRAGAHSPARIVVTDPDHIEKSNLNRQFLFHSEHIGQSKSAVAAKAVHALNPAVSIEALNEKFCPATSKTVFTDSFLQQLLDCPNSDEIRESRGVVLTALDCVASRRYTDARCVALRIPLFESGTLGTKGHVQVVLPGLTESYNSQRDDDSGAGAGSFNVDGAQSIPYCTLKSFPSLPVHCIEWAREKFASAFTLKPTKLSQLLTNLDRKDPGTQLLRLVHHLLGYDSPSRSSEDSDLKAKAVWLCSQLTRSLSRFIASRPTNWVGCVQLSRDKFERYFNHKARQLLHTFPPDTTLPDGSRFWKLPRRQPTPVTFDSTNSLHQLFVVSYARLLADQLSIPLPDCLVQPDPYNLETHLEACFLDYSPPVFKPSAKQIFTEDSQIPVEPKDEHVAISSSSSSSTLTVDSIQLDEHLLQALKTIEVAIQDPRKRKVLYSCDPTSFEKDNDRLAHVDFITAAANLRATMYGLSVTPRHEVRRIAGRIVPAIATTTAAVAGLVCLEVLKHVCLSCHRKGIGEARNAFLNLALPVILLSEPAPCPRTRLPNGYEFTLWDRLTLPGPIDFSSYRLVDLLRDIKQHHALEACVINQGNRMVYVNYLPLHASRLDKLLRSLLVLEPDDRYVDLLVAYSPGIGASDNADYVQGPPLRLMLS